MQNRLEIQRYSEILFNSLKNGFWCKEYVAGSRRSLYLNGRSVASMSTNVKPMVFGGINDRQFSSFLGQFNKCIYKSFLSNSSLYDLKVEFKGLSKKRNIEEFDKLAIGCYFYNVDLSSAYWQVAYRLGYINKKMFDAYIRNDDYKMAKRLCISFLARKHKAIYSYGQDIYEIHCDTSILNNVYTNIRHELYAIINGAVRSVKLCLDFNTDGIVVMSKEVEKVKKYFQDEGLIYKTTQCRKLSPSQFINGATIKNFRKWKDGEPFVDLIEAQDVNLQLLKKKELESILIKNNRDEE